jgi:site-specific DNA-methyltransferase (adenine-specific)
MTTRWQLINGDCREQMRLLPDCLIDAIVTDPPYELGFMGKAWDSTGIAYQVDVWRECLRVLKHGGHLLAFGGSRTYHRLACAVEDAGFQIRDQIMWVYGSGFPKSLDVSKAIDKAAGADLADYWQGWGTALKPAHEPIVLARKPLDGTVAQNVLWYGTGALNIDGCRIGTSGGTSATGIDLTHRVRDAKQGFRRNTEITQLDAGRFPANLIHDGSDEVLELFPDSKAGKPRSDRGTGGIWSGSSGVPCGARYGHEGSAARFFYCAKASKTDRNEGLDEFQSVIAGGMQGRQDGSLGSITMNKNHHPTVKPTTLMRYLIRLVTPPDGTVLDPFTGSGSTGKAAILEGFRFVGIEQDADYVRIADARIRYAEQHYEG